MLESVLQAFTAELIKLSFVSPEAKAEAHHRSEKKDWKGFEKNLKSRPFRQAVTRHKDADEKLKSYVKALGEYKDSKETVGQVLSRSSGRKHRVKKLASGRLGCSCKDWTYTHSHAGTDCAHIKAIKGMQKTARLLTPEDLMMPRVRNDHDRGKIMEENRKRLRTGHPLIPLEQESYLHSLLPG